MADDERQAEIEAAARAFLPETPITHPAIGEIGPDAPAAIRYEQRREALAAALDRVRNARGDDEACPDCWGGRPKWAGTMPAPPCPTCDGTGKRSPQGEDDEKCGHGACVRPKGHTGSHSVHLEGTPFSVPQGSARAGESNHDHEWVDARNSVMESGEVCLRCGAVRPSAGESDAAER